MPTSVVLTLVSSNFFKHYRLDFPHKDFIRQFVLFDEFWIEVVFGLVPYAALLKGRKSQKLFRVSMFSQFPSSFSAKTTDSFLAPISQSDFGGLLIF